MKNRIINYKLIIGILTCLSFPNLIFSNTIQIEKLLDDFENNAFDARERYSGEITVEGIVEKIDYDFEGDLYISLGKDEIFAINTLSIYGLDNKRISYINKKDRVIISGELGYTEMFGIQMKNSKFRSDLKEIKIIEANSSFENPVDISKLVEEKEANIYRALQIYGKRNFFTGKLVKLTSEESFLSNKNKSVLEVVSNSNSDSIEVELNNENIANQLGVGDQLIFSGVFDKSGRISEVQIESELITKEVQVRSSSLENPLTVDEIIEEFSKNEILANKMFDGNQYIVGTVGSVEEGFEFDNKFNKITKNYLILSGNGFFKQSHVHFNNQFNMNSLVPESEIIISGKIKEFNGIYFDVEEAKFEKGRLLENLEKITSSLDKPINAGEIVNQYEVNASNARSKFVGKIYVEGYVKNITEEYISLTGTNDSFDLDILYVYVSNKNQLIHLDKEEKLILSGFLGEEEFLGVSLQDSSIENGFSEKSIQVISTTMSDPINAEEVVDLFENNPLRARYQLPEKIFVIGFSDGVKEEILSEGTDYFLQFKGTRDAFDLDYLFVSFSDENQYKNIEKGKQLIVTGNLGTVEFLGVTLDNAVLEKEFWGKNIYPECVNFCGDREAEVLSML